MTVKQANGHFKDAGTKYFPFRIWDQDIVNCVSKPEKTKLPNPEFAIKDVTHCVLLTSFTNSLNHTGRVRRRLLSGEPDAQMMKRQSQLLGNPYSGGGEESIMLARALITRKATSNPNWPQRKREMAISLENSNCFRHF